VALVLLVEMELAATAEQETMVVLAVLESIHTHHCSLLAL
jgi:hypothetical protein